MRRGAVALALAVLLTTTALSAVAHEHDGWAGPGGLWDGCVIIYHSDHLSGQYSAYTQDDWHYAGGCQAVRVEAYVMSGGSWTLDYDVDNLGPAYLATVNGSMTNISYTDHDAIPTSQNYWVGRRVHH